ncbi:MAG: hypothetical protein RL206_1125 [Bacteroidota bacterium]
MLGAESVGNTNGREQGLDADPRPNKLQPNQVGHGDIGIFWKASNDSIPSARPGKLSWKLCRMGASSPNSRGTPRPRACRGVEPKKQAAQSSNFCAPPVCAQAQIRTGSAARRDHTLLARCHVHLRRTTTKRRTAAPRHQHLPCRPHSAKPAVEGPRSARALCSHGVGAQGMEARASRGQHHPCSGHYKPSLDWAKAPRNPDSVG